MGRSVLEEGEGQNQTMLSLTTSLLRIYLVQLKFIEVVVLSSQVFTLSWMVIKNLGDFSQDVSGLLTKALNLEMGGVAFLHVCKRSLGILMYFECEAAPAPGGGQ